MKHIEKYENLEIDITNNNSKEEILMKNINVKEILIQGNYVINENVEAALLMNGINYKDLSDTQKLQIFEEAEKLKTFVTLNKRNMTIEAINERLKAGKTIKPLEREDVVEAITSTNYLNKGNIIKLINEIKSKTGVDIDDPACTYEGNMFYSTIIEEANMYDDITGKGYEGHEDYVEYRPSEKYEQKAFDNYTKEMTGTDDKIRIIFSTCYYKKYEDYFNNINNATKKGDEIIANIIDSSEVVEDFNILIVNRLDRRAEVINVAITSAQVYHYKTNTHSILELHNEKPENINELVFDPFEDSTHRTIRDLLYYIK